MDRVENENPNANGSPVQSTATPPNEESLLRRLEEHIAGTPDELVQMASAPSLPAFGASKPYPPSFGDRNEYVVEFTGPDDPLHGYNWSFKRRYVLHCNWNNLLTSSGL